MACQIWVWPWSGQAQSTEGLRQPLRVSEARLKTEKRRARHEGAAHEPRRRAPPGGSMVRCGTSLQDELWHFPLPLHLLGRNVLNMSSWVQNTQRKEKSYKGCGALDAGVQSTGGAWKEWVQSRLGARSKNRAPSKAATALRVHALLAYKHQVQSSAAGAPAAATGGWSTRGGAGRLSSWPAPAAGNIALQKLSGLIAAKRDGGSAAAKGRGAGLGRITRRRFCSAA